MKFVKKTHMIFAIVILFGVTNQLNSEPMTYYTMLTNHEETRLGEYLYYGMADTIFGSIRTNNFLPIGGNAIYGRLIASQELIFEGEDYEFENVIEHAPPYYFPEQFDHLRQRAVVHIPSRNRRNRTNMTWIKFRGHQGIDVYQYPNGTPRSDSLYSYISASNDVIIFVDGEVEVEGIVVGRVTLYSSGNMYLINNIQYYGSNHVNGWFEHERFPHFLGLVSDRNIIIEDNNRNGKENGWAGNGERGPSRHSININGSLIALGGSFTFEHQNDDRDLYRGSTPDERGYVNLKGSVAQSRRGYLHRDNNGGTGYRMKYNTDPRLLHDGPPGFRPGEYPDISGRYDRLTLIDASYTFTNTIVNELIVTEGAEIQLNGVNALTVRDSLIIPGTLDNPVTVRSLNPNSRSRFVVEGRYHAYVDIQHTNFSDAIEVDFEIDSLKIRHTQFDGEVSFEGNVVIDSCIFQDQVLLTSWQYMRVKRSIFKNGIDIGGDVRDGELMNNNIVGAQYDGIILHRFSNFRILNNIIANNRGGVNNRFHEQPELLYNCVYGNSDDNWLGCERGQGSISVDPRMVNYQRFEYDLIEDSPCIDAGDPSSPLDPDETRADIGAHYFDHEPWSIDEAPVPDEFHISTFPNPFNSSLRVSISNPQPENVEWSIVNINGQIISGGQWNLEQGKNEFTLNSLNIDTPGVYFLKFGLNGMTKHKKLICLP